ncbi:3943_t:CDS:2, partial [Gigaspora margarita]
VNQENRLKESQKKHKENEDKEELRKLEDYTAQIKTIYAN